MWLSVLGLAGYINFILFCHFKYVLLLVNFCFPGGNLVTSANYCVIKQRLMEEYVRLVVKNCEKIFEIEELLKHKLFLIISRCWGLVTSSLKPDCFMLLPWNVGVPICVKYFLYVPDIWMSTPFFINNQKFKQSPRKSVIC